MNKLVGKIVFYAAISLYAALLVLPLLTLFSVSFRTDADVYNPSFFPPNPTLEAYQVALEKFPILRFLGNSLLISSLVTLGVLIISSCTGYALARISSRVTNVLFALVIGLLLVPGEVTFLPLYIMVNRLGWIDSYLALTLPFIASPIGIFLMRQFMKSLPQELFDAARMDGAGHLRMLWHIAMPLATPALGALAALTFLGTWNMYLWPLVVTNSEPLRTAQIALRFISTDEAVRYNIVAAAAVIILLPTLIAFLIAQRAFVRGIAMGSLKG
jgi:sn-glycerol 3-phosphate transport system permease protein